MYYWRITGVIRLVQHTNPLSSIGTVSSRFADASPSLSRISLEYKERAIADTLNASDLVEPPADT